MDIKRSTKLNIRTRNSLLLAFASVIWGVSFVVQQSGGMELGAYTFNSFRMLIGAAAVSIAVLFTDKAGISHKPADRAESKRLWFTGIACGVFLSIATNLQQVALNFGGSTGKAGFLTAVYILIVPLLGLFMHKKCAWNIWISVGIALVGLYFLCLSGRLVIETPDLLLLGCALAFAFQIVTIDRFGPSCDGLRLSAVQFLVVGVISLIPAIIFEILPFSGGFGAWLSLLASGKIWLALLYMGIASCGIGYTIQIIAMRGLDPTVASLLMSLESVFALISGMIFLHQKMSGREVLGCCLMFAAICLSQIDFAALKARTIKTDNNVANSDPDLSKRI